MEIVIFNAVYYSFDKEIICHIWLFDMDVFQRI